ncbi:hypothetical protein LMG23994_03163 [Cupriavidus pinatubonensis]|uniref:Uncharacterized protein n=1 Tax=Cupriavidus pinatubonensis TaxID=248026 RepID=A0ABM8X6V3_9BURK|nr:hypothetical protein [Cupriavidus pinatubonensis]CAG9175690.1 hypothetical protein LMG23994_03163 [Cupriavidus pinatubonensis]
MFLPALPSFMPFPCLPLDKRRASCLLAVLLLTTSTAGFAAPTLSGLASLLLGTVRGKPSGMAGVTRLTARDAERQLGLACAELARATPIVLDSSTRLTGCATRPGKIVEFHLQVTGVEPTREDTKAFMVSARPILERGVCRNPDVPVLGKLGVTLDYRYAAGQEPLVVLHIPPGRCNTSGASSATSLYPSPEVR